MFNKNEAPALNYSNVFSGYDRCLLFQLKIFIKFYTKKRNIFYLFTPQLA